MSMTEAEIREALARAEREIVGLKAALACCPASTPPCELDTRWQDLVRLWTEERYARCAAERERYAATEAWKSSVDEWREMSTRAETAEARCRELEAERAIVADYLRDTDADFRARRPSERAVLDALLSPPPPHTCQIHRATSGASDCGLEPCEEAKVHRDLGAARPAETATPEDGDPQILGIDVVLDPNCPIDTLTLLGTDKDGKPVNAGRIVGLRSAHPADAKCATCGGAGKYLTCDEGAGWVTCHGCGGAK